MSRHLAKLSGAALAALALVATANVAATADPSPLPDPTDCNPAFRSYAAVGSDTTQDVWNGLTNGSGPITNVASWDAFGSSPIITKCGGDDYTRPAGSGAGVRALSAVWDSSYTSHAYGGGVLTTQDVDFARSSSGPSAGTGLTYLPFARDAVTVAYNPVGTLTGLDLTTAELKEIYSGVNDTGDPTVTFVGGLPQVNSVPVQPKIPQPSSGTRAFFLGAIGVSTVASYVEVSGTPSTLPENDAVAIPNDGDLVPFSAAQWIAQKNAVVTPPTSLTGLEVASINGQAPTAGTTTLTPGPLFGTVSAGEYDTVPTSGAGNFNRDTYNVVPTAFLTGTAKQTNLVALLTTASGVGSTTAEGIISSYGFGNLAYLGDTTKYRVGAFLH